MIRPDVGCSKPAMSRSVVVFPQPDGPRSEKNSPLAMSRSIPSTATSVNRLVRPASSTRPPATGYLLPSGILRRNSVLAPAPGLAGPAAWLPVKPELPGGEPHGQLERSRWRHFRVLQRDQNGQPVQHRGQGDGEIFRVDGAELPVVLAGQHQVPDRLPPALVELLPDRGH